MVTLALLFLWLTSAYGGGVAKPSGLAQFWTDDFKVFEQVYGKTSDKDLYGATLPPNIKFTLDLPKPEIKASEKKERYYNDDDTSEAEQPLYNYAFGDRYAKLFAKNTIKSEKKKPTLKFVGVDIKPISENSDPETYNYLKHLEQLDKQKIEFPEGGIGGFKPYIGFTNANTKLEDTEAYRSIQDILDAHEANKGNKQTDEDNKLLRYGTTKSRSKVRLTKGNSLKTRCRSGRCRKRNSSSLRVGARPYVRRIKHRIVNY